MKTPGLPESRRVGEGWLYEWPGEVSILLDRMVNDRHTPKGEITVRDLRLGDSNTFLTRKSVALLTNHRDLILYLKDRAGDELDWAAYVDYACQLTLNALRTGETTAILGTLPARGTPRYALYPFAPYGQPTILYGDGGTGKSLIAMASAVAVQTGEAWAGLTPTKGLALYLDWETDEYEHQERLEALAGGLGLVAPPSILYQRCFQPFTEIVDSILSTVTENRIDYVVLDSLGAALGGDPDKADVTLALFNGVRRLKATALLIDHISKHDAKGRPFGSTYKFNYSRSAWELRKAREGAGADMVVGLYHQKANNGRLEKPIGLAFAFEQDDQRRMTSVRITRTDVREVPQLAAGVSLRWRIKGELGRQAMTAEELASELNADLNQVKVRLSEMRKRREVDTDAGTWWLISDRPDLE